VPSLAHRGQWTLPAERNTLHALKRAFASGWGVELDVRDLDGDLVISHDPPRGETLALDAVIDAYVSHGCPGALAVNIKADGLGDALAQSLRSLSPSRWFAFDMSVPDTLLYARAGLPFFTRHSDVEPAPALYDRADGVWLDDFDGGFITEQRIAEHLDAGKRIAVVSPELHGRDHTAAWQEWSTWPVWGSDDVMLCTDHPAQAAEVFDGH
jgi:glycerophosphoryl diester phosphodiesterase